MIEKLCQIVYEQKDVIFSNWLLFVTYGILCVSVTITVVSLLNKYFDKHKKLKYEDACREIQTLKKDNHKLEKENYALKKIYEEYDLIPKLKSGTSNYPPATSAELISEAMKKYIK